MATLSPDFSTTFNRTARAYNDKNKSDATNVRNVSKPFNVNWNESDPESERVNKLKSLFYEARAARRGLKAEWDRNRRVLRGKYFGDMVRPSYLLSRTPPEIFPIVRSIIGWHTDKKYKNTVSVAADPFSSFSDYYTKISQDLEAVLDSTWKVNHEAAELRKMLWDAYTYGTGILKTSWVNSLAGGMGDAKIERVDLYGFYPDPAAHSLSDANYFIEARNMSLQELDRRYPGAANKFTSPPNEPIDEAPSQYNTPSSTVPRANPAAISPATSGKYGRPGGARININQLNGEPVTVFEFWLREHYTYEVEIEDPSKDDGSTISELHIADTWRVVVVAGNHILMDEEAKDIWNHGSHPYSRYVPCDLGEFWGLSLVDLMAGTQEAINRLLSAAIHNIELLGNPILVEDRQAGTRGQRIDNRPGRRVDKNAGGDIKWMEPPKIQSDIPNFLSYFLQRLESISGLSAITKGGSPPGRNAQAVMDSLQEAAFVSIRLSLQELEDTLSDAGTKKASLIIENYNVPRMAAIIGDSGTKSTLALRARHFMMPTENGAIPLEYTLFVNAGADDDTSRRAREEKYTSLYGMGLLDPYSALKALDVPNAEDVYNRMMQLQASGMFNPPGQRQRTRS